MTLLDRVGIDPTWAVDEEIRLAGPWTAFQRVAPHTTVTVVDPASVPEGQQTGEAQVTESSYGTFSVEQWRHDGFDGVRHGRSGNRILWSQDRRHWFVTRASDEAPITAQSWVHARYVLRHAIVAGLLDAGHDCFHGLAVSHDADDGSAVAIAGATLTGKTRLANRLIERDVLADVVEDDCVVVDDGGTARSLIPTQHELRRVRALDVAAVVELRADITSVADADPALVRKRLAATPLSWPISWLPGPPRAATVAGIGDHVPCLEVPARADDPGTVDAVAEWLLTIL